MSNVTLQITADTERKLRDQADQAGLTLEAYLTQLAERAARNGTHPTTADHQGAEGDAPATPEVKAFPKFVSRPRLTDAEFKQQLEQLAIGPSVPTLPADFSRADIYDDHD